MDHNHKHNHLFLKGERKTKYLNETVYRYMQTHAKMKPKKEKQSKLKMCIPKSGFARHPVLTSWPSAG